MVKTSNFKDNAIAFLIPLAFLLILIFILNSSWVLANQKTLSPFITFDFIITIPFIYFLLIRTRKISNFTIVPFLILCIVIASYTIPPKNQDVLHLAKTWLIPFIEVIVLILIGIKLKKAIGVSKKKATNHCDFNSALIETCESLFPKTVSKIVANEITLIYYGFFNFKKTTLQPNEFSNYKESGILSTLGAFIFVIGIEMVTVHILTARWNPTLAWLLTGLTFYSALQLIGIIRSVPKQPIIINTHELVLRFGILSETIIPYDAIENIAVASSNDYDKSKTTKTLSLLGEIENSNIVIHLKRPQQINFIYGKPKTYTKLLLFVDNNQHFKAQVEAQLLK